MARMWLVVLLALAASSVARPEGLPPNIIILYADDLGYGDVGFNGNPTIATPNLDMMAQQGMRFTQFYTAAPICSPSRASLMTGRLPVRNGCYTSFDYPLDDLFRVYYPVSSSGLPETEITIAQALKGAGYTSEIIGKWHLGHNGCLPTERGFDSFYGLPYSQDEGCVPYPDPPFPFPCKDLEKNWPPVPLMNGTTIIEQPVNLDTLMPRYNAEAVRFLEDNQDKPFFLYMAYDEVHVPLFASPAFQNTSLRGLFGDAVQEMDNSIGLIFNTLKSLGLDNDTFVFFTSDNGAWLDQKLNGGSNAPFKGEKGETYEGGCREPAVAWWPGKIPANVVTPAVAINMDLFVTACELAGVPIPTDRVIDGRSLLPILFNNSGSQHEFVYFMRDANIYAIRYGPYKAHFVTRCGFCPLPGLIHDPPLLYQIEFDPGEQYPLNVTAYTDVMTAIYGAKTALENNMTPGPATLDPISDDIIPCCNKATDCVCTSNDPNYERAAAMGYTIMSIV